MLKRANIALVDVFIGAARLRWFDNLVRVPDRLKTEYIIMHLLHWVSTLQASQKARIDKDGCLVSSKMRLILRIYWCRLHPYSPRMVLSKISYG